MANTISSRTYRDKYRSKRMQQVLRKATIAEKICEVDNSDNMRIENPYSSQPTATVQAISGTYSVNDFTTTDDVLTVTDEVIYAEHIRDFEGLLANFDLFNDRTDNQAYAIAERIDHWVLNNLCEDATGAYTTPTGGFASPGQTNEILANLVSKVAGYAQVYNGLFLVIENTDIPGMFQDQMASGFSFADSALNNGFLKSQAGIDIYVVRSGTFADETLGTKTYTNAGHRVFGVKNVSTYASPRGLRYEEKPVSGKTGMEVVSYAYIGFKLWAQMTDLVVDITLL